MISNMFTSQQEISNKIINEINNFYKGNITEKELNKCICDIFKINKDIIYKKGKMGSIIKQRLGKKRLRLINSIIK